MNLPEGFPPGFVIGRGGTEIKRMQERYAVRVRMDSVQRRVTVRGAKFGVNAAVKELLESFEAFTIKQRRTDPLRLHASVDANDHYWRFEPLPKTAECEDVDLVMFDHELTHADATGDSKADGRGNNTQEDKWFNSIDPNDLASIAAYFWPLRKIGQLDEYKVMLVVGKTFYQLIQPDLSMRSISSSAMQSYRHGEAIRSSWSNVLDRNTCNPSLRLLVEALEARIRVESLPVIYAMKVFVRNEHHRYSGTLVYHLLDGNWRFRRGHLNADAATADVSVNQDTEFRVWVSSRSKPNGKLIQETRKYVEFDTPASATPDICAFTATVVMGPDTPADLALKLTFTVAKYHIVYEGLHFTLAYNNCERSTIRLSCRSVERDAMKTCNEEASALVHRMLALLKQPPKVYYEPSKQAKELNGEPKEDWEDWD